MKTVQWFGAAFVAFTGTTLLSAPASPAAVKTRHAETHLHNALNDVEAAESEIQRGNAHAALAAITRAITQLEDVTKHHHHSATKAGGGTSGAPAVKAPQPTAAAGAGIGAAGVAAHHVHHRHSHIHQALHDLRKAHKQVTGGNLPKAGGDVQAAEKQIREAIAAHKVR